MAKLTQSQIAEFYHRSFIAVDGLWFMKIEEKYGVDTAFEIDKEVWEVVPKIQARLLKEMTKLEGGMEVLFQCLTIRFTLYGFTFKTERTESGFRVVITKCPWHENMVRAGREALSERVGTLICNAEYPVFASEFDKGVHFELKSQLCKGAKSCILEFNS